MTAPVENLLVEAIKALVQRELQEALRTRQEAGPRPEGYLSTAEAARRAGVAPDTVQAWVRRGILAAVRPAGTKAWRIRPGDLERLLSEQGGREPVSLDARRAAAAARLAAAARKVRP